MARLEPLAVVKNCEKNTPPSLYSKLRDGVEGGGYSSNIKIQDYPKNSKEK